ncbi:MAG: aldehyde dehydrogenase family protein, partial [Deltaproteobacteria bacterium]|nr:aldehyde dehydrogenase family protein [Deltaproteobacteria bacterium]
MDAKLPIREGSNSYIDRRQVKALIFQDRRKQDRRRKNETIPRDLRKKKIVGGDPRRREIRRGFFCPIEVMPESTSSPNVDIKHGKILDISNGGMAIIVEGSCDWLDSCEQINVKWSPSETVLGKVVWKRNVVGYLGNGNTWLLGLEINQKGKTENQTPQIISKQPDNLKKIASISELTEIKFHPCYIAGEDIDSGVYQFAISTDGLISDPQKTVGDLENLMKGIVPHNYWESVYGVYSIATEVLIEKAIDGAHKAWQQFRNVSISRRKQVFSSIYENLIKHERELINLMVKEGHPLRLARWEYAGMVKGYEPQTINFYADQLFKKLGVDNGEHLFLARKPDGVVCIFPPSNAPCPNSLVSAFALLAGNSVIVKPPLRTPISTLYLWKNIIIEALEENGVNPGIVSLIIGDSSKILDKCMSSPKVNDIVYFGDSDSGLKIGLHAYAKGKKPILEMSGNDAMVIWKDADLEGAATSLVEGFLGSMQMCMVARRAIVHP